MNQNISAKELRLKLPQILKDIQTLGKHFTVTYHCKVVAELGPVLAQAQALDFNDPKRPMSIFTQDHPEFAKWKPKKTAVQLVRNERD